MQFFLKNENFFRKKTLAIAKEIQISGIQECKKVFCGDGDITYKAFKKIGINPKIFQFPMVYKEIRIKELPRKIKSIINTISKYIAIPIGFGFFYKSFELIFNNYASVTAKGRNLFLFLVSVWSLYGVAAIMSPNIKNISYNLLDIVAKNFYGLYIYYKIVQASKGN